MKEPRTLERKFIRNVIKRGYFITASGCTNVVQLNDQLLLITTSKRESAISISRNQIRKAIRFLQVYRTAIRRDMERFTSYSSALFGILLDIFKGDSKLQSLKHGLYRLSLLGVRFYASGLERDPSIMAEFKKMGGKYVLLNYYQLLKSPSNWFDRLEKEDLYCLIDSGAYSYFQEKQKRRKQNAQQQELFGEYLLMVQYIEGYSRFINQWKDHPRILGFFPFDVIGDPQQTKENHQRLIEKTDAKIHPVWQITDSLEELQQLVDKEYEMIAIGGMVPFLSKRLNKVRTTLNKVYDKFPTVNFHFLGVANELLLEYPCYSSDSTAFLNARKSEQQRKVYLDDGTRVTASDDMSTLEIIKQNLSFLMGLESITNTQLSLDL